MPSLPGLRFEVPSLLQRDPIHRGPGCWYIQNSRMLRHLDERTVDAMARDSALATYAASELLHEAGTPMDAVTFISQGRVKVCRLSRDGKQQTITLLGPGRRLRRDRTRRPARPGPLRRGARRGLCVPDEP